MHCSANGFCSTLLDRTRPAAYRFHHWPTLTYLVAFIHLELYYTDAHLLMLERKRRFLPLLLTFVYSAIGLLLVPQDIPLVAFCLSKQHAGQGNYSAVLFSCMFTELNSIMFRLCDLVHMLVQKDF